MKSWETHTWSPKFIHSTAVGLKGAAGTSASQKDCVSSGCKEGIQRGAGLASAGDECAAIGPTAGKHFCQIENPVISFPILFHSLSPRISVNRSCQGDSLVLSLLLQQLMYSDSLRDGFFRSPA